MGMPMLLYKKAQNRFSFTSVSYTHLDVYKRQNLSWLGDENREKGMDQEEEKVLQNGKEA